MSIQKFQTHVHDHSLLLLRKQYAAKNAAQFRGQSFLCSPTEFLILDKSTEEHFDKKMEIFKEFLTFLVHENPNVQLTALKQFYKELKDPEHLKILYELETAPKEEGSQNFF